MTTMRCHQPLSPLGLSVLASFVGGCSCPSGLGGRAAPACYCRKSHNGPGKRTARLDPKALAEALGTGGGDARIDDRTSWRGRRGPGVLSAWIRLPRNWVVQVGLACRGNRTSAKSHLCQKPRLRHLCLSGVPQTAPSMLGIPSYLSQAATTYLSSSNAGNEGEPARGNIIALNG